MSSVEVQVLFTGGIPYVVALSAYDVHIVQRIYIEQFHFRIFCLSPSSGGRPGRRV